MQISHLRDTYVHYKIVLKTTLNGNILLNDEVQLGLVAYLGLALVIGRNGGNVQHKAYVGLIDFM